MPSLRPTPRFAPLLLAFALPACGGDEPRAVAPRDVNVLLVSLDSTRRDHLSCYGRRPPHAPDEATTPHLDRLAAEGARFTNARSTSSWTLPSHVALLTGQNDLVHAVELDPLELGAGHATLAEVLAERGWRTAGYYSGPYLEPRYGFGRGFERYAACYGAELAEAARAERAAWEAVERAQDANDAAAFAAAARAHEATLGRLERLSHRDVSAEKVTDAVLGELDAAAGDERPWFVFAHYFDPHYDYVAPAPYDTRFDPDYAGDEDGADLLTSPSISVVEPRAGNPYARRRVVDERDLEHVLARYDGELAWTDHQIGRILERLRATGELESTVVVVVSDHGDEFFEHDELGHRKNLYGESVRVPLLLRYPPTVPAGATPDAVVSIEDVFATVCELTGVDAPGERTSQSLVPLATGADDGAGRAWLGRLVKRHPVSSPNGARGWQTWVGEGFAQGPIKILRWRRWTDPEGPVPPQLAAQLAAEAERDRARDLQLVWIDVEAHPDEPAAEWSREFDDPRAAAALERYRALYPRWLALRADPGLAEVDAGQESRLRALGYTSSGSTAGEGGLAERFAIDAPEAR